MFINGKIGFNDIYRITEKAVMKTENKPDFSLEDVLRCDSLIRAAAYSYKETLFS